MGVNKDFESARMDMEYDYLLTEKISKVYELFDRIVKKHKDLVIAYSGGKDSTLLLILLYKWLVDRGIKDRLSITILHNDTLGEINPMEFFTRNFMEYMSRNFKQLGHEVKTVITTPPARDTFYWRLIIRGYPAPTFNFRWCVNLLKLKPTTRSLEEISHCKNNTPILIVGLREDESTTRQKSMNFRYGSCNLAPGKCHAYYFSNEIVNGMKKLAPLRNWSNTDVWSFLRSSIKEFNLNYLLFLYGCEEARYGCWHCTLIKTQWGLKVLPKQYQYLDAVRILYRKISDIPSFRMRKMKGYSKRGALNATARSVLLHLLLDVERIAGLKFYGLDEAKTLKGFSLREVFYELEPEESMQVIRQEDPYVDPRRLIHISNLRDLSIHKLKVEWLIKKLQKTKLIKDNVWIQELLENIRYKVV